jgi:hypothetical protein
LPKLGKNLAFNTKLAIRATEKVYYYAPLRKQGTHIIDRKIFTAAKNVD